MNMKPDSLVNPDPVDAATRAFFRQDKRPDKRNFIDRIQGRTTDRLPYWEASVSARLVATILEKPLPARMNSPRLPADDFVELARRTGLSGIGFGIYYSPCRQDKRLQTRSGFEQIRRAGPPDFSPQLARLRSLKQAVAGTNIGLWVYTHGPFDPIYLGMELEKFWLLTIDDPAFLYEVGDYLLEINTRLAEQIVAAGVDWLHIGDDVAFKSGLFVKPDFFFDYYPQRLKQLIAPARKAGIPVTYHSDGKVDTLVDMLVECGVAALNPIEPYSNDIVAMARLIAGRMGIIGNVELAMKTPQQVYARTRELIAQLGPRYVPASSHSVTDDVSAGVYAAFLQAIQEGK